jgi:CheY-like chemotaxis protein
MKYKILLTGKNRTIIDDFFYNMNNELESQTTSDRPDDILSHEAYFKPDAFVFCLAEENRDTMIRVVNAARKLDARGIPFVIAGTQEDCEEVKHMAVNIISLVLEKPLTAVAMEHKLITYLKSSRVRHQIEEEEQQWQEEQEHKEEERRQVQARESEDPKIRELKERKEREKRAQAELERIKEEARERRAEELKRYREMELNGQNIDISGGLVSGVKVTVDQTEEETQKTMSETVNQARPAAKPKSEGYRGHILVIDDDPRMLRMIKEELHGKYDVATAINGKLAMKFLETKHTDLVLLDYEMPVENGPMVLQKIRAREETKNLPVIFLTGINDREKIQTALSMKPQGYILKPIDLKKLYAAIQNVIG